ncbi:DUF4833 domain-containing protein [Parapedobacter koreensis]|uniref:DUF4833 domain-containing protein n=1 Tax=Parapedobacter koreensis TaxID=332977 RepID=A0A1H7F792_9SPHI|nr:DUF4833 domain-containing protein [Parapedobacter koreensis]SEK21664.1 protein of unknown function [Parapedobacter koreensis]
MLSIYKYISCLAIIVLPCFAWAIPTANEGTIDTTAFPIPKGVNNLMFYIQRDPNANTVCYALNLDKQGRLDKSKPLDIFWMRYAEDGRRQDLNYIQRVFAYGIKVKKIASNEIEFRSVAYDKLPLYLRRGATGYYVQTRIDGETCVLRRIYVRIEGGSLFSPNVLYVQIEGVNRQGKAKVEQIKP